MYVLLEVQSLTVEQIPVPTMIPIADENLFKNYVTYRIYRSSFAIPHREGVC